MTIFGNGKHNSSAAKQLIQEQIPKKPTLRDLVPNDEKLYSALQMFLLGDPQRQLPILGSVDSLLTKGDNDKVKGERLKARMNYETAAKIEMYNRNKEGIEKSLRLAKEMTENGDRYNESLKALLANVDEAMRISELYYASTARPRS
jgi:hypothetical protein